MATKLTEAIATGLKQAAEDLGRPHESWTRDEKGDETWWLHQEDGPLVCVVMNEQLVVGLTEEEGELLARHAGLDPDIVEVVEPSYLAGVYVRPLPR